MLDKSPERQHLERLITSSCLDSHRESRRWIRRRPLQVVQNYFRLWRNGDVSDSFAKEWQSLPSRVAYNDAYARLEKLEQKEGYPAMRYYAAHLDRLKSVLPEGMTEKCYYPYAGTDFYWARLFRTMVCEDDSYNKNHYKSMWWRAEQYSPAELNRIQDVLRAQGIIGSACDIKLCEGDAEIAREDNDFNFPEWTLLLKGGQPVLSFFKRRFQHGQPAFGACILVSPAESRDKIIKSMEKWGYQCIFYDQGEDFFAPFTLSLKNQYVFLRKGSYEGSEES